eukprot:6203094-Pleurochrysis_carterae.AAC.3
MVVREALSGASDACNQLRSPVQWLTTTSTSLATPFGLAWFVASFASGNRPVATLPATVLPETALPVTVVPVVVVPATALRVSSLSVCASRACQSVSQTSQLRRGGGGGAASADAHEGNAVRVRESGCGCRFMWWWLLRWPCACSVGKARRAASMRRDQPRGHLVDTTGAGFWR